MKFHKNFQCLIPNSFVDFAIFIAIEALGKQLRVLSRKIIIFACVVYLCHYFIFAAITSWLVTITSMKGTKKMVQIQSHKSSTKRQTVH